MTLNKEMLEKVRREMTTFIETGTYLGGGVDAALQAGFTDIHSIESNIEYYNNCVLKYKNNPNVRLYNMQSSEGLEVILKTVNRTSLFWLDAHYDPFSADPNNSGNEKEPLLSELTVIQNHCINTHTIMIDDRRMFDDNDGIWKIVKETDVLSKIKELNPNYKISYRDSLNFVSDIILAEVYV